MTKKEHTTITELFQVLDLLESLDMQFWLDGGWGVDVLYGQQTRLHRDIDIDFDANYTDQLLDLLQERGYQIETNWLPTRMELTAVGGTVVELDGTVKDLQFDEGGFMLLPQTQAAWNEKAQNDAVGAYLAVLCRISQNDGNGNFNLLYPKPADVAAGENYGYSAVPVKMEWEPGKKYTYTLDFFGNGGGGQVDPDKPGGGEDIVGGPIKFTVTVDTWNDVNTDIEL